MDEFTIKECKTKGGMEAKPTKNIRLDLKSIESKYHTLISTPIAIVITAHNTQVIVHSTGTLLFKKEKNIETIATITKELYRYKQ